MNKKMVNCPLVHVGLPVYNGERFIRIALEALVAQDYPNFEIIVLDNASTDSTCDIVREFMSHYTNISLHINEINIGIMNMEKVFELCNAPYFMWAAHDDKYEPTFISKTVAALEQHPEAVLCNGHTRFLDEQGNVIVGPHNNEIHTLGMNTKERVCALSAKLGWFAFYSMMRTNVLKKVKKAFHAWGTDVIFLEELSLLGSFILLPEILFNYRVVNKSVSQSLSTLCEIKEGKVPTPYSDLARNLIDLISHTDLPEEEKSEVRQELFLTICFKNAIWNNLFLQENLEFFKESINQCRLAGSPDANEAERMFRRLVFETKIENPQFESFTLIGCSSVYTSPYGFNVIHDCDFMENNALLLESIQLLKNLMYPISLTNLKNIADVGQYVIPYAVNIFFISDMASMSMIGELLLLSNKLNIFVGHNSQYSSKFDFCTVGITSENCRNWYFDFLKKNSDKTYPSLTEFISKTTLMVEQAKYIDALEYYYEFRYSFQSNSTLVEFDGLMAKLKSKVA